jgi:hypothetical protein
VVVRFGWTVPTFGPGLDLAVLIHFVCINRCASGRRFVKGRSPLAADFVWYARTKNQSDTEVQWFESQLPEGTRLFGSSALACFAGFCTALQMPGKTIHRWPTHARRSGTVGRVMPRRHTYTRWFECRPQAVDAQHVFRIPARTAPPATRLATVPVDRAAQAACVWLGDVPRKPSRLVGDVVIHCMAPSAGKDSGGTGTRANSGTAVRRPVGAPAVPALFDPPTGPSADRASKEPRGARSRFCSERRVRTSTAGDQRGVGWSRRR